MTTALDRILTTPLKATERGGMSSVRVAADGFHVATISAGMNDQPEYARLFAASSDLLTALIGCQKALAMMTSPQHIVGSSVQHAWAAAVAAETKARTAIAKAIGDQR
jgi:hypothetical protein